MTADALTALGREALLLIAMASLPPLLASLAAGLLMGLFQAATQIQESTLASVPKLVAAGLALAGAGPWIASQLARFTVQLLALIPEVRL
jgi:flagellar biosynthesis protein FliQ